MCDSTPWSIYSSWLRNSKLLSLRTEDDLIYLERDLIKLIKFSVPSAPPSVISFGKQYCSPVLWVLCCTGLCTLTCCSGQGICAHGELTMVLLPSASLCRVLLLCTWFQGREVERVKNLIFWFLCYLWGLHNTEWICWVRAQHQESCSGAGSEQDHFRVWHGAGELPWLAQRRCWTLEQHLCVPHTVIGESKWPQVWPSPVPKQSQDSDRGTRWESLILQHSQRAGLFYTKYLHFLWLLRAGYSFGLFWPGQVWAFLQRFLVQLFISTRSLKNIACPQCHARLKHQQAVSLSFAHPLCVVLW